MIKFVIIIGRKYFSNYVKQSNYLIIQTKLLTTLCKNNIETEEHSNFVETQKLFLLKRKVVQNTVKWYAEKNMLTKYKKLALD